MGKEKSSSTVTNSFLFKQTDPMDLHSVIDDIGKRHGIDADKLRLKLIHVSF